MRLKTAAIGLLHLLSLTQANTTLGACMNAPNEFPKEELLEKLKDPKRDKEKFYYYNPRITPNRCGPHLSLEEKVAEQAGKLYPGIVGEQLDGLRDREFAKFVDEHPPAFYHCLDPHSTLNHYATLANPLQALNEFEAIAGHPALWPNVEKIFAIRKHALQLVTREYGEPSPSNPFGNDDEADAFRHFIGSALLVREFGPELAKQILNSHEKDDVSMSSLMDRYNNAIAVTEVQAMIAKKKPSDGDFVKRARKLVASRELVVLWETSRNKAGKPHKKARLSRKFQTWGHWVLQYRLY